MDNKETDTETTKSCLDCLHWIPKLTFHGCSTGGTFPAHCPNVLDPDKWVAKDCSLFEKRILKRVDR